MWKKGSFQYCSKGSALKIILPSSHSQIGAAIQRIGQAVQTGAAPSVQDQLLTADGTNKAKAAADAIVASAGGNAALLAAAQKVQRSLTDAVQFEASVVSNLPADAKAKLETAAQGAVAASATQKVDVQIVQATVTAQAEGAQNTEATKQAEEAKKAEEEKKKAEEEKKKVEEEAKKVEEEKKKAEEAKKVEEEKKKAEEEKKKVEEDKKKAEEDKKKAEENKKKAEEKKAEQEKKKAEIKKKIEEKKAEIKKKQAEAKAAKEAKRAAKLDKARAGVVKSLDNAVKGVDAVTQAGGNTTTLISDLKEATDANSRIGEQIKANKGINAQDQLQSAAGTRKAKSEIDRIVRGAPSNSTLKASAKTVQKELRNALKFDLAVGENLPADAKKKLQEAVKAAGGKKNGGNKRNGKGKGKGKGKGRKGNKQQNKNNNTAATATAASTTAAAAEATVAAEASATSTTASVPAVQTV
ncbi:uncharacterized protein EV422DRAFT_316866 [Fimicolochytrium jonesii]|uniref:uncharacterized protein n=1 Tax=Fimicolochytrium jonesii TaxID=1396493 RepID=UPI0022FEB704|nr:uncharacterized protein EV422DRAFT_316866 [Fimicolochytrium jonesii]KAI8824331.1 hypothetical protein EV422DRAFT_316866 [Fimicolochytrium jonesii]